MKQKYNVGYFREFHPLYLNKDIFLKIYYISKLQGIPLIFQYSYNADIKEIPNNVRGCRIVGRNSHKAGELLRTWDFVKYSIFQARKINVLYFGSLNHFQLASLIIFKLLNPKGRMCEYGDIEYDLAKNLVDHDFVFSKGVAGFLKRKFNGFYFKNVVHPIVNQKAYREFKNFYERHGWKNVAFVPPCLDNEMFDSLGLTPCPFEKKENVMIYVGRLGAHQKNTDMMLEAFSKVDFQDWKVFLIGPVTTSFLTYEHSSYQEIIDQFFENHPHLKDKIFLTGPIYDQKKLFEYYIRAKVFVLTSRHEGAANVLAEAAALGCYFVGTDVGIMDTVTNNWQFGTKIKQEDSNGLADVLNKIVRGEIEMDVSKQVPMEYLSWDYVTRERLLPLLD